MASRSPSEGGVRILASLAEYRCRPPVAGLKGNLAEVLPALAAIVGSCLLWTAGPASAYPSPSSVHERFAARIPAFARLYRTSCSTCHSAAPKLNVLGEAFRLNGYRMPVSDLLIRGDDPVPLGNDAWREEWPRAIWPSDLPGLAPFALRIQADARATRDEEEEFGSTFRFPNEIYLLAGAPLGESIGTFFEAEWSRERDLEVVQAKVKFQDIIPGAPERLLNLWVGQQNLYLFTFTDRQIDRAARQKFGWQSFSPSDIRLEVDGDEIRSEGAFELAGPQPALELNGLLGDRLFVGLGVAQGTNRQTDDDNGAKDFFYKVRYKLGGMSYRGTYGPDGGPVTGSGGQLLDRALIVEHFGYFGEATALDGASDRHRSFGVNVRGLYGPLDAGIGWVRSDHDSPWAPLLPLELDVTSIVAKVEYLGLPWLMWSVKFDRFRVRIPDMGGGVEAIGFKGSSLTRTRILPGAVLLIRQNVRAVVEGELFLTDTPSQLRGTARPHNLWLRLDVSF